MRVLVMVAVVEEAEAVLDGLGPAVHAPVGPYEHGWLLTPPWGEIQVLVGGVGPATTAAATATAIVRAGPFDLVLDAGLGGGFAGRVGLGAAVLANHVVAADLGAETFAEGAAGFVPLDAMGFGGVRFDLDQELVARAADRVRAAWPDTHVGTILTVSTVTGFEATTARLTSTHPDALVEAMEGFGVVTAATPWNLPTLELRTVSNPVGVREREQWDLPRAFTALTAATTALLSDAPALLGRAS